MKVSQWSFTLVSFPVMSSFAFMLSSQESMELPGALSVAGAMSEDMRERQFRLR